MIRRAAGPNWLLISQIDHARLAGELAECWALAAPLHELARELRDAIRHHDDGWEAWEQAPMLEPARGFPRDFREMPPATATAIWSESIARCAAVSTWGGLWVSRHFCELAEHARPHHPIAAEQAAYGGFLDAQRKLQAGWKAELAPAHRAAGICRDLGVRYVQFFDFISLWLCCEERSEPSRFDLPAGGRMTLIPRPDGGCLVRGGGLTSELSLGVEAMRIPRGPYRDDASLHAALMRARPQRIEWKLIPAVCRRPQ